MTTIRRIREAIREQHQFLAMSAGWEASMGANYRWAYIRVAVMLPLDLLTHLANANHCAMRGHDYVDHSYGGPESGCVDIECERCGHGHYQRLY